VKIVGTGPGDSRYITPLAWELIENAQVLVGGQRQLASLAGEHQEQFVIGNDLNAVLRYIESHRHTKSIVVLASGDPGLYSIANYLTAHMDKDCLELIPGISSIQLMFARLKMSWQDVQILSVHGRSIDDLDQLIKKGSVTALLTGGQWTPQVIADYLLKANLSDYKVAIGKDLSYSDEKIIYTTLDGLVDKQEDYSNSVMVIFNE
jgi:cobalt-precorrin-7 (C5)-methyltransferase